MHPFRTAVEAHDIDAALDLFSDDVEFRSPVVFKPYKGIDSLRSILTAVSQVLEDWTCVREIGTAESGDVVLHFRAHIGDREVEGADFIHHAPDGSIDQLMVMVRPLSAAIAMAESVGGQLAATEGN
jgi:SnoaL-like domain